MPITLQNRQQAQPNFRGLQDIRNYKRIDELVARGGQPQSIQELQELKNDGVGLVINFRTLHNPRINFVEQEEVKKLGMKYISMPLASKRGPSDEDLFVFSKITDRVHETKTKTFIHCAWGKDRTGIMSAFYKLKYGLDNLTNCVSEMLAMGHDPQIHPNLIPQLKQIAQKHFGITK